MECPVRRAVDAETSGLEPEATELPRQLNFIPQNETARTLRAIFICERLGDTILPPLC
jgi:hypothetical protein